MAANRLLPPEENERLERRLRDELLKAEAAYNAAVGDERRAARVAYLQALARFTGFVMSGKIPHD